MNRHLKAGDQASGEMWLCLFLLFTLSLAACQRQPEKPVGPPEKITIAYPTTVLSSLLHVAFAMGAFRAEGLEVTAQPHEFGKMALQSVLEGKSDLAVTADTPVMFAVTSGKNISVLAVIITSKRGVAIIARRSSRISRPADLKGKRIGLPLGTTAHFFLDSFLSTRGVGRERVGIVDLKPNEMTDALLSGRVDAVSIWQPTLRHLQKALGDNGITFYDEHLYSDISCIVSLQDFTKKHPERIRNVLKALLSTEIFMRQAPEESRRYIAESIKIDKVFLEEIWGTLDFRVTLDQFLIVSLEDQTRWAQKNRLIKGAQMPNYHDYIYFDGLQSVKPEAVTIIR